MKAILDKQIVKVNYDIRSAKDKRYKVVQIIVKYLGEGVEYRKAYEFPSGFRLSELSEKDIPLEIEMED